MVRLDRITMQGFKSFANRITIPFPNGFNCVCGPNGSGKSTRWDTEVILDTGEIRPIGEIVETALKKSRLHIKLDDGVFTPENPENIRTYGLDPECMKIVKKDISAFIKREGEKYLYKFTTKTGKSAVTTGCHPIMVFRDGKIISEVIENLKKGDLIATPRKLELPEIDKLSIGDEKIFSKKISYGPKPKTIKLPVYINEDFARFLGYLVGDGSIIEKAPRCDFTNMDAELIEDFANISKSFGIEPVIYNHKNHAKVVALHSRNLHDSLVKIFNNNIKKEYKHIPSSILFSRKSVLANFLAGLFDCDGTVRKDNPTFEYTTMSEKLADQVQLALLRYTIVARKTKKMKHATNTKMKTKRPYFYITIEGIEKLKLLYENIPIRCVHKKERLEHHTLRNIVSGSNIDVLPQEVNNLVRTCVKMLGINVKPIRKKYPWFAAYNENMCCPTRRGLKKILEILNQKFSVLINRLNSLSMNQEELIEILSELKIRRSDASEAIGLNPETINNKWAYGRSKAKEKNVKNLYDFVKTNLEKRLHESENIMNTIHALSNSDIFWDKIDKIEKVPGEKWVYDLTIPNCHNFIGNGIFVHNSNIIDGLLFVLGTSSARSIRAMKLQNLLFNGARDKKPADFCEVSIYLDNTEEKIPGGEKEVKITRRVTRSGISIYKLNGRTVTRAKILDTLSYANLSAEGYNIIMQGDVTKIIEMSPAERKGIIDEISGISEFDDKKEKASRELEKVEIRVRENMIVVAEKQKLVARLKQDKENAERYKDMEAEMRKAKASLLKKRMKDALDKQSAVDGEIGENTKRFDQTAKELSKTDDDLEKKEKGVLRKSDELVQKSRNYEILRRIDQINNEIIRKRDRIEFNQRELERVRPSVQNRAVKEILNLKRGDVYGTLGSLHEVQKKYSIALEVALGRHSDDIVVDTDETAAFCIKYLKERKLGRARFIPLSKINSRPRKKYGGKAEYAIDLIKFDRRFLAAFEYALGSTLVVKGIDDARRIKDFRVATLDGDLVEVSGAMIGGFYRQRRGGGGGELVEENEHLEAEIAKLEKELEKLRAQEQKESEEVVRLQEARTQEEKDLETLRKRRKELYEERMVMQGVIGKAKIEKAKLEASLDNLKAEFEEFAGVEKFFDQSLEELQERVRRCVIEINQLGPVNMKAIEEFETMNVEFEELRKKLDGLLEEKEAVMNIVKDVEKRRYDKFMETFRSISENFSRIYRDMTNGDGLLRLEVEDNIDSGLIVEANPSGKKIVNLDVMSGGEKTITSLAFLFAAMQHYSSPFYVLDEIDAALDKANTKKVDNLIKKYSKEVQFIVITHNDLTIAEADNVFGVSMEGGVSKVFGIEMPAARG